jgi:Predicted transcriptional regulators containing the CopG/Arc/MetJ DNA-binding domain and a metal-binding domain
MNNRENINNSKVARTGVTFPEDLLQDFDGITKNMGYHSRSKAIQDVIRLFVTERSWMQKDDNAKHSGVILAVYEYDAHGLDAELTESKYNHKSIVTSSMLIHVNDKECLDVIAIRGEVSEVKDLSDELATMRGVKKVKTIMATV